MNAGQVNYITRLGEEKHFQWENGLFKALLVLPNLNIPEIVLEKWSLLQ